MARDVGTGKPGGPSRRNSTNNGNMKVVSDTPDDLDLRLQRALQIDGRASFSKIADVLGPVLRAVFALINTCRLVTARP